MRTIFVNVIHSLFLMIKAENFSKHNRGKSIWILNKMECECTSKQAGFVNPVSIGAVCRGHTPFRERT